MGFREWAIANPTLMEEYKRLLKAVEDVSVRIQAQEQILKDVKHGITPLTTGSGFLNLALDPDKIKKVLLKPTTMRRIIDSSYLPDEEDEDADEVFIIQYEKEQHSKKLKDAEEEANRILYGYDFSWGDHIEGLYDQEVRLLNDIECFDPFDHIIDWHKNPDENILRAIHQRLWALDWHDNWVAHETDSMLEYVIDPLCLAISSFQFELIRRSGWTIRLGDDVVTFTRRTWLENPLYPLQRALIAYIESRWDYLVQVFRVGAPPPNQQPIT